MKKYPKCEYRYNPIGYELCNHGNDGVPEHKKNIRSCCANVCPLGLCPKNEKMTCQQMYDRDMKKLDEVVEV